MLKLLNLLLKLLIVVGCSSFVEAVECVVESVNCLCALESSSFVEAVESVVDLLIVVGYYML